MYKRQTTNNEQFYRTAKLLRSHGIQKTELWDSEIISQGTGDSALIGHNFRLSDISASLGISQLNKIESFLASRAKIARIYDSAFKGESKFRTLKIPQNIKPTYHLYPILLDSALFKHKKAIFRALLDAQLGVCLLYTSPSPRD